MMAVASWGAYCVLVAALLGAAAWGGESALRRVGRSGRWVWLSALAGSLAVPAVAYWQPALWRRGGPGIPEAFVVTLPGVGAEAAPAGAWSGGELLVLLWAAASVLVLGYAVLSLVRLGWARRGWRRVEVDGVPVFVSSDVGPAVFAAGRTSIVVPEWALELDDRFRRLMLLHEAEHARAGDPTLLLAAFGLVAVMPWNPALWWQLRRLRLAVEVDCDARVVAATGDLRGYGTLLLEVGRHRSGGRLVVAFSEPRSFLERRIRILAAGMRGRGVRRALAPAAVGAVAVLAAVCARDPASPGDPLDAMTVEVESADISAQPRFSPMTVRPRILNTDEIAAALRRAYPPLLRDAGIGGTVEVWFFVDEQGRVAKRQLNRSSGYDQLDAAALEVAAVMELSPAENRDQRVPVWVSIPITFSSNGGEAAPVTLTRERVANDPPRERSAPVETPPTASELRERLAEIGAAAPVAAPGQNIADQPVFTPMTQRPRILNTAEVERGLTRNYPAMLRNAGIGGTVEVWFFVDENGRVLKRQLNRSSGYDQLDEAALRVAETIRMSPARNRDDDVAVWVSVPITFSSK